jgi:hypothetical protein
MMMKMLKMKKRDNSIVKYITRKKNNDCISRTKQEKRSKREKRMSRNIKKAYSTFTKQTNKQTNKQTRS